jgi:hypothetical protein
MHDLHCRAAGGHPAYHPEEGDCTTVLLQQVIVANLNIATARMRNTQPCWLRPLLVRTRCCAAAKETVPVSLTNSILIGHSLSARRVSV